LKIGDVYTVGVEEKILNVFKYYTCKDVGSIIIVVVVVVVVVIKE
jgi:hypothetical protein